MKMTLIPPVFRPVQRIHVSEKVQHLQLIFGSDALCCFVQRTHDCRLFRRCTRGAGGDDQFRFRTFRTDETDHLSERLPVFFRIRHKAVQTVVETDEIVPVRIQMKIQFPQVVRIRHALGACPERDIGITGKFVADRALISVADGIADQEQAGIDRIRRVVMVIDRPLDRLVLTTGLCKLIIFVIGTHIGSPCCSCFYEDRRRSFRHSSSGVVW